MTDMRILHVTTPLMTGDDVSALQFKLGRFGFISSVDGIYGPVTEGAVRAFQQTHALAVDGIFGPATSAALDLAIAQLAPSPPVVSSVLGQVAETEALRHVGIKESPPNSNQTPFGIWYGVNGVPWCNIFVSYCFAIGAGYIICDGFHGPGVRNGKGCAYVPTTKSWLLAKGLWLPVSSQPAPGDIVIFNLHGTGPDHIGLLVEFLDCGLIKTVEGNTSVGNDSDGGEVMVRMRKLSQVDGFGRVF